MMKALQHLQQAAGDLQLPLDGLVGVGVGAELDELGHIAGARQLLLEQLDRIGLVKKFALEVQSRGQVQVGMRGAREAIDAAVFAAAVGIDGLIEGNVGRIVVRDDAARGFGAHGRRDRRVLDLAPPAIVHGLHAP